MGFFIFGSERGFFSGDSIQKWIVAINAFFNVSRFKMLTDLMAA